MADETKPTEEGANNEPIRRSQRPRKPTRKGEMMNAQKENKSPQKRSRHAAAAAASPEEDSPPQLQASSSQDEGEDTDESESNYVDVVESSEEDDEEGAGSASPDSQDQDPEEGVERKKSKRSSDPNSKERERRQKESANFESLRAVLPIDAPSSSHEETLEFAHNYIKTMEKAKQEQEEMCQELDYNLNKLQMLEKQIKELVKSQNKQKKRNKEGEC